MNKKTRFVGAIAIALSQSVTATPAPEVAQITTNKTETREQKHEAIPTKKERGMGVELNNYGGLDFDHERMWRNSPIFDPKRPHPIQSYRSQQRAAKKRKRSKA